MCPRNCFLPWDKSPPPPTCTHLLPVDTPSGTCRHGLIVDFVVSAGRAVSWGLAVAPDRTWSLCCDDVDVELQAPLSAIEVAGPAACVLVRHLLSVGFLGKALSRMMIAGDCRIESDFGPSENDKDMDPKNLTR